MTSPVQGRAHGRAGSQPLRGLWIRGCMGWVGVHSRCSALVRAGTYLGGAVRRQYSAWSALAGCALTCSGSGGPVGDACPGGSTALAGTAAGWQQVMWKSSGWQLSSSADLRSGACTPLYGFGLVLWQRWRSSQVAASRRRWQYRASFP